MKFYEALKSALEGKKIRMQQWNSDVFISIQVSNKNSKMTARYLYVTSRFGLVPWIPTQIEILSDQWEIYE